MISREEVVSKSPGKAPLTKNHLKFNGVVLSAQNRFKAAGFAKQSGFHFLS
jgi:hypothetical protein